MNDSLLLVNSLLPAKTATSLLRIPCQPPFEGFPRPCEGLAPPCEGLPPSCDYNENAKKQIRKEKEKKKERKEGKEE